jgi:tRNA threonylcarbamoyl adenosine modification protein YeaZ
LFMTILALEFSTAQRSVAVLHRGGVAEAVETGGHGTNAFSLIERVLAEAGLEREQIGVIAVGLGPGSYTGIRVALSIAQGWQLAFAEPEQDGCSQTAASAQRRLARGVKLLGVSSAECLAAQAQAEKTFGRVNVVIDAQRNEFYRAAFEISPAGWREIEPLHIAALARISPSVAANEIWTGPEVTRWFPHGRILFPSALALGRLAGERSDFVSGNKLVPIYLRPMNFVKAPSPNPVVF